MADGQIFEGVQVGEGFQEVRLGHGKVRHAASHGVYLLMKLLL